MKVLLIVDPQNDFFKGGALAVKDADSIIPVINALINSGQYDLIIVSQDFHPAGHSSFASSHPGKNLFEEILLGGIMQRLWPDHCVQGTPGADFHRDLLLSRVNKIIQKGTDPLVDSYSAFRDNARGAKTGLEDYLMAELKARGESNDSLWIDAVGLALDYCLKFTGFDAKAVARRVRVILDGTRAVDAREEKVLELLSELRAAGMEIENSKNIIPQIRSLGREVQGKREVRMSP